MKAKKTAAPKKPAKKKVAPKKVVAAKKPAPKLVPKKKSKPAPAAPPAKPMVKKPGTKCAALLDALPSDTSYQKLRKYTAPMLAAIVDDPTALRAKIRSRQEGPITAMELVKFVVAEEGSKKDWSRKAKTPGASRGRPRADGSPAQPRANQPKLPSQAAVAPTKAGREPIPLLPNRVKPASVPPAPISTKILKLKPKSKTA